MTKSYNSLYSLRMVQKTKMKSIAIFSVKQRCLAEQKRRKQRATKKISMFIGSFVICFAPYVITR